MTYRAKCLGRRNKTLLVRILRDAFRRQRLREAQRIARDLSIHLYGPYKLDAVADPKTASGYRVVQTGAP